MQSFSPYLTCRSMLAKKQGKGFSETETKEILRQVLAQLNTLHERRQSHGSISLDTIAYDQKRMMIVLLPSNGRNNPIYLAPEVVQTRQATPTADIYAVAVVMIVLLTGMPPEELKTATDMWNWEERCNISDRFIQILNIALSATRDFRYVNAGQMIRSLKPIIAIPEPKIDPNRINPAIASASPSQLESNLSGDVSQDDLSMPTVAEASQYLNPIDPISPNQFNSIPPKKSPFVAFTNGSNSIGSTKGVTKLDGDISAKAEDKVNSQFNRLEITGKSQGDTSQGDFCAFQLPFSNANEDDLSQGEVPKNNKASLTKVNESGEMASSQSGSLISLKDEEDSIESMPTSKFRLLLAAIFAGGVIVGGLLSILLLYRFVELNTNKNLQTLNSADLDKAIARVYETKKTEENIDKLLILAKYKYEYSGNLSEVETMLQSIPSDLPTRNKADQLLVEWKEDQKKNTAIIQEAENALKNGNWQLAIDTVKTISPTPYWQERGKMIAEDAKQKLAGINPKTNSTANINNNASVSPESNFTNSGANPASVAAVEASRDTSPTSSDNSQPYSPPSSARSSGRDSISEKPSTNTGASSSANISSPDVIESAPPRNTSAPSSSPAPLEPPVFSTPPASPAPPAPRLAN
jgi:hypothetical protein